MSEEELDVKKEEKDTMKGKENKFVILLKTIWKFIIFVFAIIGFISIILLIGTKLGMNLEKLKSLQSGDKTTSTETTVDVTDFGLKDIGKLITQTSYTTVVIDNKEPRKVFDKIQMPFTTSRLLFSYEVRVDSGIDFEKITATKEDEETIKVNLPHAEIYEDAISINEDTFKSYIDEESWFSRIDSKEQNVLRIEVKEKAKETASKNNINSAAESNAERMISEMITNNENYKNYKVNFEYIEEGEK